MTTTASVGLTARVAAHMEQFADSECGGWLVAEDHRDGTAVVVWQAREMFGGMPGIGGTMLWRWMWSLRGAGFAAVPRTDLEVFGRPDEESEYARWLHITAWSAPGLGVGG